MLVLIGIKMALSEVVHIPVLLSLFLVVAVLAVAIVLSLLRGSPEAPSGEADTQ